jgi:hypothetical protein
MIGFGPHKHKKPYVRDYHGKKLERNIPFLFDLYQALVVVDARVVSRFKRMCWGLSIVVPYYF